MFSRFSSTQNTWPADVELIRRRVKYLRLQVKADGSIVAVAPNCMPVRDIQAFLEQKRAWIEKKQAEIQQRHTEKPQLDDHEFMLHGEIYKLCGDELNHEQKLAPANVIDSNTWAKQYARQYLSQRLDELANEHGFTYQKISIRNQKTRWGSCSAQGNISLNWRLVQMPKWVCDYVLIHELAHTVHMNHSKAFWQAVADCMPEYKQAVQWLKTSPINLQL